MKASIGLSGGRTRLVLGSLLREHGFVVSECPEASSLRLKCSGSRRAGIEFNMLGASCRHFLDLPFGPRQFSKALLVFLETVERSRDLIAVVGSDSTALSATLLRAIPIAGTHLRELVSFSTLEGIMKIPAAQMNRLAAVIVEAPGVAGLEDAWITKFQRRFDEAQPIWICAGRDPLQVRGLRRHARLFLKPAAAEREWVEALKLTARARLGRREAGLLAVSAKEFSAAQQGTRAERALGRAIKLDPLHPSLRASLGRTVLKSGDPVKAEKLLRIALELNPCAPEVYLALFNVWKIQPTRIDPVVFDRAEAFCPESLDLRERVGQFRSIERG